MRLLHTSDWHLGRNFHGSSLLGEQAEAIDALVEMTAQARIEVVLIAGDLYDRAIPPLEAVGLFGEALSRLRATGATVVAISGNHDSSIRVGVYDPILAAVGVTVRGDVMRADEPVLVESPDGGPPVAIYPLPYLDPASAGPLLAAGVGAGVPTGVDPPAPAGAERHDAALPRVRVRHDEVTRLATGRIRADLARRPGTRSVVVAHTFVAGGETCESERALTIGNVETVGVEAFAGFDYVALGHLHGSQQRDGPRVAYSGTPLPYSFSEQDHVKSVRVVELAPDGGVTAEVVPLGVGRPLRTIEGTLDELLTGTRFAPAEPARVRVHLTDASLPMQAMARLRRRFPHAAELHHRPGGAEPHRPAATANDRTDRAASPLELTMRFWAHQHGRSPAPAEAELLVGALDTAGRDTEQ